MRRSEKLYLLIGSLIIGGCATPDRWHADLRQPLHREMPSAELRESADGPYGRDRAPARLSYRGETLELSVEDAVFLALQRNRDLRIQRLNPVISGAFAMIERGAYDPRLFADLQYQEEQLAQISRATGELFEVRGDSNVFSAGVRQRLPTGTDVTLSMQQNRTDSDRTPEQQSARLGLNVTQSLLRGMGPAVNLASVRQAQYDSLSSFHALRGFTESLLADVEIAYWRYVLSREQIAIFEESVGLAESQLRDVEDRIEVGSLAPAEAAAARAEVARRREALIDARSALNARRLRLARLINPGEADQLNVSIRATSSAVLEDDPITDTRDRVRLATQSRPDLQEAMLRLRRNELEVEVTRNGLLPQLDLFFRATKFGFGDNLSDSLKVFSEDAYDVTVGLSMEYPLGNRVARGRNLASRASRLQAEQAVLNLQQMIQLDVLLSVNEVERARQQISARRETRRLAEQTAQAELERFQVGSSTALLVAQAQRDLLAAQISEVEAVVGYRVALIELYLAEGSLLERRGVVVEQLEI